MFYYIGWVGWDLLIYVPRAWPGVQKLSLNRKLPSCIEMFMVLALCEYYLFQVRHPTGYHFTQTSPMAITII